MHRKTLIALLGAMVLAVAVAGSALAAGSGPAVHVQIRSLTKTLRQVTVHGERGWIRKDGTPRGKCSGSSAMGALDAATHGRWTGKYYASLHDVFVTSILGVKPRGNQYWSVLVNGKAASTGACHIRLHAGERLQFKIVR
jgi:hypothetical protein